MDIVQIADPQGWFHFKQDLKEILRSGNWNMLQGLLEKIEQEPFFSERHFQPNHKIIQARVTMHKRNIMHIQFILAPFIEKLPALMRTLYLFKNNHQVVDPEIMIDLE